MTKATERSEAIYAEALRQQNTAQALTDQANVAKRSSKSTAPPPRRHSKWPWPQRRRRPSSRRGQANKAVLEAQLAVLVEKRQATQADYIKGVRERWGANAGGKISEQGWARPSSGIHLERLRDAVSPDLRVWMLHNGVDIAGMGCGATIYAAHSGTVTYAGPNGTLGNYIQIEHGDGTSSGYGHIKPGGIHVSYGQQVDPGQPIAQVGSTGASTGCHLHFMIRVNGQLTNPVPFMRSRGITIA